MSDFKPVACRQCGEPVFVAALPHGQYRLLDAEPAQTTSGYVHVPAGRVSIPRFVPATTTTTAYQAHWSGCRALTPYERTFAGRYDEFDSRARARAHHSTL
jgi:hypothetical protein